MRAPKKGTIIIVSWYDSRGNTRFLEVPIPVSAAICGLQIKNSSGDFRQYSLRGLFRWSFLKISSWNLFII